MKKLLIPLLCCLTFAWSCKLEGNYSAQNVWDIVTITDHQLVNDNGVRYTISRTVSKVPDLEEGGRYYMEFDILNSDYEITLRSVTPVDIVVATSTGETGGISAHDPVIVKFNWIGPKYMDLAFNYYYDEKSNCAHNVFACYSLDIDPSDNKPVLNLFLFHDGNDENPSAMSESDLKLATRIISIPLDQGKFDAVTLTLNILSEDNKVESKTYSTK